MVVPFMTKRTQSKIVFQISQIFATSICRMQPCFSVAKLTDFEFTKKSNRNPFMQSHIGRIFDPHRMVFTTHSSLYKASFIWLYQTFRSFIPSRNTLSCFAHLSFCLVRPMLPFIPRTFALFKLSLWRTTRFAYFRGVETDTRTIECGSSSIPPHYKLAPAFLTDFGYLSIHSLNYTVPEVANAVQNYRE